MLSNAYFLAKFRFDTAENEPAKNLQKFAKFANFADPNPLTLTLKASALRGRERRARRSPGAAHAEGLRVLRGGDVRERRLAKFRQNVARFRLYRL